MNKRLSPLNRLYTIILLCFSAFVLTFCASTSELEKEEFKEMLERAAEQMPMAVEVDIDRYINQLSDNYAMLHNSIPESFRNVRAEENRRNRNHGFRVQIISTRDLREAESLETEFLTWMRENEVTPQHQTYIRFRQPYYRLHLGDFISRSEAIQFSQIVRQKYPNAWVVPDQIDPDALERKNQALDEEINNDADEHNGSEIDDETTDGL